jgi:hypothetical protein
MVTMKKTEIVGYKHGNIPIWKEREYITISHSTFEWLKTVEVPKGDYRLEFSDGVVLLIKD